MNPFAYSCPVKLDEAITDGAKSNNNHFIAGGTTLLDLMKLNVMAPETLIDINQLGFDKVEKRGTSTFIGALASNSDVAHNKIIHSEFPVLSQALLSGASVQLRNMATVGGNIMQRTRCAFFRDTAFACNKRNPGSGCAAVDGFNRMNAVLGGSDRCVATHASDMCVALVALDAIVHVRGPKGERSIPITDFHLLPGSTPDHETVLQPGEIISEVEIPASPFAKQSHYLKVRDRASYAFALCSVAVALEMSAGKIKSCRLALGGVATKPWRSPEAESILTGKEPSVELFKKAAEAAMSNAKPLKYNAFKIALAKRSIVKALKTVGGLT